MKSVLIILNVLLGCAVLWGGVRFFRSLVPSQPKTAFTVKKRKANPKKLTIERFQPKQTARPAETADAQIKRIVEQNIFNPDRCPNAGVWGGNARVDMTLVGTFKIGKSQGAVILQKTQNRNFPFMPFGGMMGPGGGPGGGMMPRRMGIGRGGFGGGNNDQMRQNGGDRGGRRMIGGMRSIQANRNAQGIVQPGQNNTNTQNVTYKQYVRLGETMANGYKLTEISRNRAVLTRGSDRLELELADPSANAKQAAKRTRPPNQTQVMQQMLRSMQNMQRAQMMQGFQMMRMNQMNQQNQQNQGGRGGMMPRRR